jgi:hypothetical protein
MKRFLAAAAVLATLAVPTASHAFVPGTQTRFISASVAGCHFAGLSAAGSTRWTVELDAVVQGPGADGASCDILVNGVTGPSVGLVNAGPLWVQTPTLVPFNAFDTDVVELCMVLRYGSTRFPTCGEATTFTFPPFEVADAVDALLCPLLVAIAPINISNQVIVETDDGDVYLLGSRIYDCPLYGD